MSWCFDYSGRLDIQFRSVVATADVISKAHGFGRGERDRDKEVSFYGRRGVGLRLFSKIDPARPEGGKNVDHDPDRSPAGKMPVIISTSSAASFPRNLRPRAGSHQHARTSVFAGNSGEVAGECVGRRRPDDSNAWGSANVDDRERLGETS